MVKIKLKNKWNMESLCLVALLASLFIHPTDAHRFTPWAWRQNKFTNHSHWVKRKRLTITTACWSCQHFVSRHNAIFKQACSTCGLKRWVRLLNSLYGTCMSLQHIATFPRSRRINVTTSSLESEINILPWNCKWPVIWLLRRQQIWPDIHSW